MTVSCTIDFPRLPEDEMRDVDYLVMGHAFEIHRELGCLCDEAVYKNQLAITLRSAGLQAACEVPIEVSFRSFFKTLFLDLVVNQSVIYELKTVTCY